jgi:type II secretory pathway predicted ATPase ExeA
MMRRYRSPRKVWVLRPLPAFHRVPIEPVHHTLDLLPAGYLTHHLKIAGRADTLFSTDAVTVIHNAARGYPRAVNNLAINALTAAFARNQAIVDEKATRIAVTENGGD